MTTLLQCTCGSDRSREEQIRDKQITSKLKHWHEEEKKRVQILLLGIGESGKSTITKQMKIIHINGFDKSEKMDKWIPSIRKNIRDSMLTLCGAMSLLQIPLHDSTLQNSIDYLMTEATQEQFEYPQAFFDHCSRLWQDGGIKECYWRSNEYQLIDSAKYFLSRIEDIKQSSYVPSEQDILRCRIMTNSVEQIDFTVKDRSYDVNFSVYDVGGQRGERRRWLQVFDCIKSILFVVDSACFDLNLMEDNSTNRLMEALDVFDQVWNNRFLRDVSVILFINKIDVLEGKIRRGQTMDSLVKKIPKQHKLYNIFNTFSGTKPTIAEEKEFLSSFPMPVPSPKVDRLKTNDRLRWRSGSLTEASVLSAESAGRRIRGGSHADCLSVEKNMHGEHQAETVRTAVFIKNVFMHIRSLPRRDEDGGDWHYKHDFQYYYTCAVDTDNIRKVLEGSRSLILKRYIQDYF